MSHAPAVRTQSIRVALGATLVVGVIYALIAAVVIGYATVDLTSQIDARLVSSLNGPQPGDGGGPRPAAAAADASLIGRLGRRSSRG